MKNKIKKRFTRVIKMGDKWNCYLQIEQQGFCVVSNRTKKEANWYADMLSIALEKLVISVIKDLDKK